MIRVNHLNALAKVTQRSSRCCFIADLSADGPLSFPLGPASRPQGAVSGTTGSLWFVSMRGVKFPQKSRNEQNPCLFRLKVAHKSPL